ncbi:MAG: glycosyltransferase [Bacteriovorax sp.]|nr:glycosyltransferase [Bacteriovorax sp.]
MKKNFIIYAPAINIQTGGAHSILENFLISIDPKLVSESNWSFIGNSEYEAICASSNIHFHALNLNKKWFLRIVYDYLIFKGKFLKNSPPSIIISMQNTTPFTRDCDSTLTYIHQAIPFIKTFKPHPIKNLKLFLIKHFYFFFIKLGITREKSWFIVQSKWLKEMCAERLGIPEQKFFIHRPMPTDIDLQKFINKQTLKNTFFYPSLFQNYKNHLLLIEAFILLAQAHDGEKFVLELTIDDQMIELPLNLEVKYYGMIPRSEALQKINNATAVIYPSSIESYGIPIAEAIFLKTPVLASDLPYARELIGEEGIYFDSQNPESIKKSVERFLQNGQSEIKASSERFQDWTKVLENFLNKINK